MLCFKKAQQRPSNPALLIQGAAATFCGIFERIACQFLHLSGNRCIFFSYHKLKVFSPIIEAEGFSCSVALTGLQGEEKVRLVFQVDVQEKSEESNKWKLKQLSLPLSAIKQSGSAKIKQLILFLFLKTAVFIQAKQPQEPLIVGCCQ